MELFGYQFFQKTKKEEPKSFVPEVTDDGAVVVSSTAPGMGGGSYGTYVDMEGSIRTESELVTKYREMAQNAKIEAAIDDIINDAIVADDEDEEIVKIKTDKLLDRLDQHSIDIIEKEFEETLELLDFENNAHELFKRWYIDGRIYFHAIQDETDPANGIVELRYIDPRKIRKVREVRDVRDTKTGLTLKEVVAEYYIFNDAGFGNKMDVITSYTPVNGYKIALDTIVQVTSGLMDKNNSQVLSYLHKAIKPLNMLNSIEDAILIYRISRAPERRLFYISVGNLPTKKAEEVVNNMMVKHKNKLVYDAESGSIRDDKKYMTMLEDYWFARRDGDKTTEVSTLPSGDHLGELTDANYFYKMLLDALNVPASRRLQPDGGLFNSDRVSEISRDEIKFSKFIQRLRKRFNQLFIKVMGKNLILKGYFNTEEWDKLQRKIIFDYREDIYISELKETEIWQARMELAQQFMMFAGKYVSHEWVRKNVLKQSEEEIVEQDAIIKAEFSDPRFHMTPFMDQMMSGQMGGFDPSMQQGGGGFGGGGFDPTQQQQDGEDDEEGNGNGQQPPFNK